MCAYAEGWRRHAPAVFFLILAFELAPRSLAVEYSDQGSHVFDAEQLEPFHVNNQTELLYRGSIDGDELARLYGRDGLPEPAISVSDRSRLIIDGASIDCAFGCIPHPVIDMNHATGVIRSGSIESPVLGIRMAQHSHLDFLGGTYVSSYEGGRGFLLNNSSIDISGGSIGVRAEHGKALVLQGSSRARLIGGSLWASGDDFATAVVVDGEFELLGGSISVSSAERSTGVSVDGRFRMSGGTITSGGGVLAENSAVTVFGGGIVEMEAGTISLEVASSVPGTRHASLIANENARVAISGGSILMNGDGSDGLYSSILASGHSDVSISGGQIVSRQGRGDSELFDLTILDNATITLHGRDFNYPLFEPIHDLIGVVTGTSLAGDEWNLSFMRQPGTKLVLVPEPLTPTPLVLVIVAVFAVVRALRPTVQADRRIRGFSSRQRPPEPGFGAPTCVDKFPSNATALRVFHSVAFTTSPAFPHSTQHGRKNQM